MSDYIEEARQAGAECHAAALVYLGREWSPLGVCPPDHLSVGKTHGRDCKSPGKAPWGPWKEFQGRRATEDELRKKWRDNPFLNVGIALGPVSRLVRADVDGEQGERFLREVSGGELPDTLEMTSGKGRGLLYAIPQGVTLRPTHQHGDKIHEGLSLLGEGSQTVLPPSRHVSGRRYAWLAGHGPDEIKPALAPPWLVQLMARTNASGPKAAPVGERITDGARNLTLTSLAGSMRRRGMSQEAILAALLVVNEQQCDPPLDAGDVKKIAASVSRYDPAAAPNGHHPGAPPSTAAPLSACEIILGYFRAKYGAVFRRGIAIYSPTRKAEVQQREACLAPDRELRQRLLTAYDCPKTVHKDNSVSPNESAVPPLFKKWAASAWVDLLDELPEEEESAEVVETAAIEFRGRVAACLFTQATFGDVRDNPKEGTVTERRSLIHWAQRFARKGPWQQVRSALLWCRLDDQLQLCIALRAGIFGQYGPRELATLSQRTFATKAELYGIGEGQKAAGQRVIELSQEFIQSLLAGPAQPAPERQPGEEG